MKMDHPVAASPYLVASPPTSPGRALLSRAYEHYCVLQWGWSGEQIAAAFEDEGEVAIRDAVSWSTRLLGELMASGDIHSWARPFGGGEPVALKPSAWELDDFRARFATSAIDPRQPFAADAAATHWIFVDLEDWNRMIEASLASSVGRARERSSTHAPDANDVPREVHTGPHPESAAAVGERLLRRNEVENRTGLSRATIYRRMDEATFPKQLKLSGNISVWRESEISNWIASRR